MEETKQKHIEDFGEELGELYHELWNEIAGIHSKWDEYVQLFGTSSSRIDLLNSTAPLFFRTAQDALWESTLLHLTRLTDPASYRKNNNLTIKRLPDLVDASIKDPLSGYVQDAVNNTKFARDWRNRSIAHSDLDLALNKTATPLELASHEKVKDALQSIALVLQIIEEHYNKSHLSFDIIKPENGAEALLYVLDDGLQAEHERGLRIKEGKHTAKDLKRKNI